MVKQFFRCWRRPRSRQLLTDGITMKFIKSVRALTNFSKSREAHLAETASEKRRKLARNYLQNWRKLIRNCLQNWRKTHQKLSSKREKGQQNFSPQYWRKFERYFLAKSEKAWEVFFSQNLIKLWKIFTPNIGESGHQKAEGGYPHPPPPPLAPPLWFTQNIKNNTL
jgi:hypothetical protein